MIQMQNIKPSIIKQINKFLDEKISSSQQAADSAKESRDNETKSSVGDKYETGRTMMQYEVEKNRIQLNKALILKNEIARIDLQKKCEIVEYGSLVYTSYGNYFISFAAGKIEVNNTIFYCISLASPIGNSLKGNRAGDHFHFQGKEYFIKSII